MIAALAWFLVFGTIPEFVEKKLEVEGVGSLSNPGRIPVGFHLIAVPRDVERGSIKRVAIAGPPHMKRNRSPLTTCSISNVENPRGDPPVMVLLGPIIALPQISFSAVNAKSAGII